MSQNVQYGVEVMSKAFNDSLTPKRRESPSRFLPRLSTMLGLLSRENGYQHPELLAQAKFLVNTSSVEGCPNVLIEAMACGRAVVASDAGDVPILVENGETGFVLNQGEDRGLVERMATLIWDRELCRCMGNAGRAKAEREFGLPRLVSETFNAYKAAGWKD